MESNFTPEDRKKLIDFVKQNKILRDGTRKDKSLREELWTKISAELNKTGAGDM